MQLLAAAPTQHHVHPASWPGWAWFLRGPGERTVPKGKAPCLAGSGKGESFLVAPWDGFPATVFAEKGSMQRSWQFAQILRHVGLYIYIYIYTSMAHACGEMPGRERTFLKFYIRNKAKKHENSRINKLLVVILTKMGLGLLDVYVYTVNNNIFTHIERSAQTLDRLFSLA